MATVTSEMIKDLRERTGAGMLDCKKALNENNGDMEASIDWLRKKGLSNAAKKSGRLACEGVVSVKVSDDGKKVTMVETNCETDFVAKNDKFTSFAESVTSHIFTVNPKDGTELENTTFEGSVFSEYTKVIIGQIGENIVVRRFSTIETDENGVVGGYLQSNRIGAIIAIACDSSKTADALRDVARNIAMHAVAMNPAYLDDSKISQADIDRETEVAKAQLEKEGKLDRLDKILPGKIAKFKKDNCLIEQPYIRDEKITIKQLVESEAKKVGGTATVVDYLRFEMGEGLEKKACDFASEVAAQLGKE